MPITGYIGTGVATEFFFLCNIPEFGSTGIFQTLIADRFSLDFETFEKLVDFIHKEVMGEYLVLILIGGQIHAALYHHAIKKDRALIKMTGPSKTDV